MVVRSEERVAGEPAPGGYAEARGRIIGAHLKHVARPKAAHGRRDERREIHAGQPWCVEGLGGRGHGLTARKVWPKTR
jgi:hypothetical protein